MAEHVTEFDYLPEEAREVGATGDLPSVRRVSVGGDTGSVDALVWDESPRLTFLHGAGLNAHTWDSTLLALGRPAVAVDLPGHGHSAWRDDFDYGPAANATAVARVLDALAPGTPQVVVGQSLGGLTAIALAGQRPDLVEALVIVDVSPALRPGAAAQVTDFLAGPQVFASRDEIVEKASAAGLGSSRRQLERGVALNTRVRDDGTVVFRHHLAAPPAGASWPVDFTALWADLEGSGVPVLLVRAQQGFLDPAAVSEFRARVPRATVVDVESGHNVQEQQPAALAALIEGFVRSL